jgi:CHAT domain-containing protein
VDLATVTRELEPGTLLLAFSAGADRTDLFALAAGGELSVHRLPIGTEELRREIETLRELIRATSTPSPRLDGLRAVSRRLFERLLAPVEARIESSDRLLLVPDGPLLRLPWAALVRPAAEGRGESYLAAWKPLATTLSATVHLELGRRARREPAVARGRFSGFGDPVYAAASPLARSASEQLAERGCRLEPLPATRRELEEIGRLYHDRARLYLGAEATEERAKEALGRAHAVHFAVHGCLDERFPLTSGLALSLPAGDEGAPPAAGTETPPPGAASVGRENGLLQAWEIFEEVRTEADMVILSACDSGLGRETTGEGLLGLTRALQYAGARTVLASLWQVADQATAELMIRFYQELADGSEPDAALRAAQLHLLSGSAPSPRAGDWELPYYWAAFQLSR